MHGRQIFLATVVGEAVQHRSHELHQRRLAGLVGSVKHRHAFGQRVDRESSPNTEAVDLNVFDFHDFCTSFGFPPRSNSTPSSVA